MNIVLLELWRVFPCEREFLEDILGTSMIHPWVYNTFINFAYPRNANLEGNSGFELWKHLSLHGITTLIFSRRVKHF